MPTRYFFCGSRTFVTLAVSVGPDIRRGHRCGGAVTTPPECIQPRRRQKKKTTTINRVSKVYDVTATRQFKARYKYMSDRLAGKKGVWRRRPCILRILISRPIHYTIPIFCIFQRLILIFNTLCLPLQRRRYHHYIELKVRSTGVCLPSPRYNYTGCAPTPGPRQECSHERRAGEMTKRYW